MKQLMEADLMFDGPEDRDRAIVELTKQGFSVEKLDWVDAHNGILLTPTVWIRISGAYEGNDDEFFDEMMNLAGQFGGEVVEAGLQ
jgi:hypothetical protein